MGTDRSNDLKAFTSFANEQLANGGADLTLDDALLLWDHENQTDEEREDARQAIRRGLADVEAGRVQPAREALAELRRRYRLPELP